jgi:hypothetical protein
VNLGIKHVDVSKPRYDALPHPSKDSNVSLKVKTMKEEGVEVRFLARNTSKVKRAC